MITCNHHKLNNSIIFDFRIIFHEKDMMIDFTTSLHVHYQTETGKKSIPRLMPQGQFGTRLQGGKVPERNVSTNFFTWVSVTQKVKISASNFEPSLFVDMEL